MTYSDQWKALSSRIHGLVQAGQLHAQYLTVKSSDDYKRASFLHEQCGGIFSAIKTFQNQFKELLPQTALAAISNFEENAKKLVTADTDISSTKENKLQAMLVILAAFESEMSFVLSDVQEAIRSRSERAFSHLQRLLVVDAEVREKWQKAFKEREEICEGLGAVHLLWHGIYAFKVNAAGERTDLVFQEPEGGFADAQRYVDGFVLTEWKKANVGNAEKKFNEARTQARRYAQGALAGSELTGYRYAVVVSEKQVAIPEDITLDGVVYRHINIAVNPLPPSKTRPA